MEIELLNIKKQLHQKKKNVNNFKQIIIVICL